MVVAAFKLLVLQALSDPHLDQGLPAYTQFLGLPIQACDHPAGEIHVYPFGFDIETARPSPIDLGGHVLARIEALVEFSGLHSNRSPVSAHGAPR